MVPQNHEPQPPFRSRPRSPPSAVAEGASDRNTDTVSKDTVVLAKWEEAQGVIESIEFTEDLVTLEFAGFYAVITTKGSQVSVADIRAALSQVKVGDRVAIFLTDLPAEMAIRARVIQKGSRA